VTDMNYTFSKIGGLIINHANYQLCIYRANTRFAKGRGTIVAFGIGITFNKF